MTIPQVNVLNTLSCALQIVTDPRAPTATVWPFVSVCWPFDGPLLVKGKRQPRKPNCIRATRAHTHTRTHTYSHARVRALACTHALAHTQTHSHNYSHTHTKPQYEEGRLCFRESRLKVTDKVLLDCYAPYAMGRLASYQAVSVPN